MSTELNDLRISAARHETEAKDASITLDTYKDKVGELQRDIEELKTQIEDLKKVQTKEKEEEKEKRKQEMLSEMMSKIDVVRGVRRSCSALANDDRAGLRWIRRLRSYELSSRTWTM
jgi:chromosome segregation ATPase